MPRAQEVPDRIVGRFVGRADEFGFAAPPTSLRLKLLRSESSWTLFVQSGADVPTSHVVEWLPTEGLLRVEFGSRRVLRADYEALPKGWARTFQGVALELGRLDPDGEVTATVTGTRAAVAAFARRVYGKVAPPELVRLHTVEPATGFLTARQDDALRAAVTAGYYRIPRALNLNQLAKRLGIGSASLSERLRRAEGRIITRYVDAGGASPWDEKTLFDAAMPHVETAWPPEEESPPKRLPQADLSRPAGAAP